MWLVSLLSFLLVGSAYGGNFYQDFDVVWGENHANIMNNGQLLELFLDQESGSALKSKNEYLFGRIDMQLKLVPGNSAGTVTTFYLTSLGDTHDEIDFEFLGNLSGNPYTLHTNVFVQGVGNREMQFFLWFDPTKNFHTYSILWNPQHIIFYVDDIPIRDFKNNEAIGVPFPHYQPMTIRTSLWSAEWATMGGSVKTDWSKAPFKAFYRNFNADGCVGWTSSECMSKGWYKQELISAHDRRRMKWVQRRHMIYNYCKDVNRFPQGLPAECKAA